MAGAAQYEPRTNAPALPPPRGQPDCVMLLLMTVLMALMALADAAGQ